MHEWDDFFLGELGAAAALAGLLFVSVSVNQARILELERMADRGIEALALLFLILSVASLGLVPGQPRAFLGGEIALLASALAAGMVPLQRGYIRNTDLQHRARTRQMARGNQLVVRLVALSGVLLIARSDEAGLYLLVAAILLTFVAVGAGAWVLLIEINR